MGNSPITHANGRLKNRFGIVTGAASGIGRATAVHMARMGAGVSLVDLSQDGLKIDRIHSNPSFQLSNIPVIQLGRKP